MRGEITHFVIVIVIAGFPCFNQTRKGCNSCVYGSINIICEEVSAAGACRCSRICIRISSGAPCPSAHLCGFSIRQPIKIARKLFRRFSELLQPCIKKTHKQIMIAKIPLCIRGTVETWCEWNFICDVQWRWLPVHLFSCQLNLAWIQTNSMRLMPRFSKARLTIQN